MVGCQEVSRQKPYYDSLFLDKTFSCGGSTRNISQSQIFRVEISEEEPPSGQCSLAFHTEIMSNCSGSCYMFVPNAFIKGSGINFTISNGAESEVFTFEHRVPIGPRCIPETHISLTFILPQTYKFSLKARAFHITLELYNKCGERGSVKSTSFEEAIKHVDGYDADGEREAKERTTYITGILLGISLSCIFLVVFGFAFAHGRWYCKTEDTAVDEPKADVRNKNQKSDNKRSNLEIGVTYKNRDPEKQPENKPLLEMTSYGPEKSPVEENISADKFTIAVDVGRQTIRN